MRAPAPCRCRWERGGVKGYGLSRESYPPHPTPLRGGAREQIECIARSTANSCEPRANGKLGGGYEFAGCDLRAVVSLDAQNLEAAVGADDREALGRHLDDLAHLAPDAFRVHRRQRLGLEDLQRVAVQRGPGAGRRIAAADQPVDVLPGPAPVDVGVVGTAAALIR